MTRGEGNRRRQVWLLPIAAIAVDRWPQGPRTLEYANALAAGAEFPPIHVHLDGGRWWIRDGRHRLLAHKLVGRREILVRASRRDRGEPS